MKFFVVIAALATIANAGIVIVPSGSPTILRSPLDSAIVHSERLGGNFAYAIAEGQQFRSVAPILTTNVRAPFFFLVNFVWSEN